ncbi:uncharacterized protein LOC124887859 [Capsicum annuum]|uniref:uncharacterized protein LOC124887859 n=1 Tax=Capsicum annuum TaxID=4072 RepID=UPI001FB05E44|nr:uncharacterized protein LOC124887859 [Capsicum annuum]
MENDCGKYAQKCPKCQIHGDLIRRPPHELQAISSPWLFVAWGMDVIGPIDPSASNGHRFILVAIDYFTKWVEAASYKAVTKKAIANFIRNNLICRFRVPESIITDNGANLNSHLMRYRTTVRTSTGATPYLLVYGSEAVIPAEVEIPSLRIIQEAGLSNEDWARARHEQLMLIVEKRMVVVCHGQLYQHRMVRAFNKKVRARTFEVGQLLLKRIFPHQEEYKGKFAPNWQSPYVVHKVLSGGALILSEMDELIYKMSVSFKNPRAKWEPQQRINTQERYFRLVDQLEIPESTTSSPSGSGSTDSSGSHFAALQQTTTSVTACQESDDLSLMPSAPLQFWLLLPKVDDDDDDISRV